MSHKLSKFELSIYFMIWSSSFSYAFYRVYVDGEYITLKESRIHDFSDGWNLLKRKKDISDDEWELWTAFLFKLIPWIILHLCLSEIFRLFFIEALPLCYFLTTFTILVTQFPLMVTTLYIIQLALLFTGMMSGSKVFVWCLGVLIVLFINCGLKSSVLNNILDHDQANLIYVSLGWFYIRCLDFVLSEVKNIQSSRSQQFINYLAYIFYLPCFFFGPFIPYDHFLLQMSVKSGSLFKERISKWSSSILLHALYYFIYEIASHYVYCNAMHYEIRNILSFGMWTVSGVGICMATFFYLKYVIIYGICSTIAKIENYQTPPRPKCIYRIHLYSKMWRHFDRGFYLFLFRCIYSPICQSRRASISRRMFASFTCFLFVYIWHGGTMCILYWSLFNFIGLICESLCKQLWSECDLIKSFIVKNISSNNIRRIEALGAAPLWVFAVVSNFMFFGGHEMGLLFIQQIIQGSLLFYATLFIIAYSMCQVSIELEYQENHNRDRKK